MSLLEYRRGPAAAGLLSLLVLISLPLVTAEAGAPFDQLLPEDTVLSARIGDFQELRARGAASDWGRLLEDPAMKPFVESLLNALEQPGAEFQQQAGISFREL